MPFPRIFITLSITAALPTQASAWERATVDNGITELCEKNNPDDWPGQEDCIASQRKALHSLRPPRKDDELIAAYRGCVSTATNEYDFEDIIGCYHGKLKKIATARDAKELAELTSTFQALPLIVRCSFSNQREIEIRRGTNGSDAIAVQTDKASISSGQSGAGYTFEWAGGTFKLDGNQLQETKTGKLYAGKCEYQ